MNTTSNKNKAGRAAAWLRQRLATGMICACALFTAFATVGCETMSPSAPVPSEAYASKPSGNLAPAMRSMSHSPARPNSTPSRRSRPNGKVSMPTIGDVSAAGKTINSLQSTLTSLYQPHLQDPTVVVSLEAASAGVYVSGEVLRPGKIPLDRPMTALEAVMEAGGFTKFANPKQVIVVRKVGGKHQRYVLNMNEALYGADSSPFYVRPFDVLYVKQSAW